MKFASKDVNLVYLVFFVVMTLIFSSGPVSVRGVARIDASGVPTISRLTGSFYCDMETGKVVDLVNRLRISDHLDRLGIYDGLDGNVLCAVLRTSHNMHTQAKYLWSDDALGYPGVDPAANMESWTAAQLLTDFGSLLFSVMEVEGFIQLYREATRRLERDQACYHYRLYSRVFMGSTSLGKNILGFVSEDRLGALIDTLYAMAEDPEDKDWQTITIYALAQALTNAGRREEARATYLRVIR
ncbi:unnamed protein product, partial [Discosporangium mesarthrocarpum]